MIHRHLESHAGYEPVAVEDILERGKPRDWIRLRDAVVADPRGEIARTILDVCANTHMYGTSALWTNFIATLQAEHPHSSTHHP